MTTPWRRRRFLKSISAAVGWGVAGTNLLRSSMGAESGFPGKFAICNETFGDWPLPKAFGLAAECGYEGIEMAPFTMAEDVNDISSGRRREIRGQAEAAGLTVVGLHWLLARTSGLHLTSPDRAVRRRTADYLGALAQFCTDLGGDLLIFGSPKQRNLVPGVDRQRGLQYAAEVIHEVLPVLEKMDVRLALEPLSPGSTNFLRTAAEAVELIQMVDSPRCQLILDCNAMSSEETPPFELIRRHARHLIHFHANDPNGQGPGFGELDFVPILRALRQIDFPGWISVEVFDYGPGAERLARESIGYMKRSLAAGP
jgi:sugar phosphate isomerase/epimerase